MAKLIIKLINSVADVVNADPDVARPAARSSSSPTSTSRTRQRIYPAADLSEQISTAGKEASGTGNMKFSMNGALTIGTLDGANVEIREEVGAENFFLFGLTADEVPAAQGAGLPPARALRVERRAARGARPDRLRALLAAATPASSGRSSTPCSTATRTCCSPTTSPTSTARSAVGRAYRDPERWTRMSILNVARMGTFSSDRSIREYCDEIWQVEPVPVELD